MNRSVRFPDELVPRIQAEADRLERSFNWVVVKTLEGALANLPVGGESKVAKADRGVSPASPRASKQERLEKARKVPGVSETWAR